MDNPHGHEEIKARRYTLASGWGHIVSLGTGNQDCSEEEAAANKAGNVMVGFTCDDGTVYYKYFTPATGWSGARVVFDPPASYAYFAHVSIDDSNRAAMVFTYHSAGGSTRRAGTRST